jgi:hypothetical protein
MQDNYVIMFPPSLPQIQLTQMHVKDKQSIGNTSVHKRMSQVCLNLDVSRHSLVYRYIQILTNLRHPFMDGGSNKIK